MSVYDLDTSSACGCDDPELVSPLMPVQEALRIGLGLVTPANDTELVTLDQVRGRVLAQPVRARADMPGFDNSGMDGYALNTGNIGSGTLPLSGLIAAGDGVADLAPGTAMRIFTGAPVPRGADTVVMQEQVEISGQGIVLRKLPRPGENIRRQGEDLKRDDVVLDAGRMIGCKEIAAAAGAGVGRMTVLRRIRVALLLTGDELAPAGTPLTGGTIWDVNTPMLRALIDCAMGDVVAVSQVPDDRAAMAAALEELASTVDLIVTSGGVSVGERDHVKPALNSLGAKVAVSGVAIKPGKPVTLSRLGRAVVVSLPGNPVAAFVTWHVFGAPIAAKLAGLAEAGLTRAAPRRRHVRADAALRHKVGRCEYRPAKIAGYGSDGLEVVSCGTATHSAQLAPLAGADGLVLIPAEVDRLDKGDLMEFLPFPA